MLALGREVLALQPFSVLLGSELLVFTSALTEIRIPVRPDFLQQHGFVHGGVVSYAADNALTYAGGGALGFAVVTSEFKINYVRPAKGQWLIARASVIHSGKTQAVCRCDVFASDSGVEKLCAVAQGTIALLSQPSEPKI